MTSPGSDPRSVTLLHLSDPQFGPYHREAEGGTPADREQQGLRAQMLEDLAGIEHEGEPVRPDLVVVTGDLTEHARPSQMRAFEDFAVGLLEGLGLARERLVIVPGNHDVSWAGCEAYFKQCEADEREAVAPYWPKWRAYAELFGRLYGGPDARFEFREGTPYSLFEYEDLRTVVAGLNSTMLETHRDGEHFGQLGAHQLAWFEEQLRPYEARGWLRIAAVHHNVMGGAGPDENLRDAKDLELRLGGLLNLVVHGHTHDGALQWLGPALPVASTGSAAVQSPSRPHGVPCQYQLLRVEPGRLRQWTRAYQEAQRRWVGDVAASRKGDRWHQEHAVAFTSLHGVFPPDLDDDEVEEPPRFDPRALGAHGRVELEDSEPDDFVARVAEVCRLRRSRAEVARRRKGPPTIEYLELRQPQGEHVEVVPIGVCERGAETEALDAFVARVIPAYRQRDPGVRPLFVYGGPPAPPEAQGRAREAGVWLRSYEQHCGLIDFRRYRQRLVERLARDRVYPPSRYVGQRMLERFGLEDVRHEDALATVRGWLDDPHGRFVLVLGTFGCGKTFLLRELARRLAEEDGAVVPILVEMRSLEKGLRLEQLLAQHFALHEVEDYSPARFLRMLEDGRVALLFDGFDELVVRTTYPRAAEHFDTIVSAARGRAKVVVTSRRQHFYSDHQAKDAVRQVLMQRVETVPGHRVVTLLPFEDDQIERFLVGHLGDEAAARERMRLIAEVRDLSGLSTNPRMLGFIAALDEQDLRAARDQEGSVSAASLYRTLLRRWLEFEHERRHPRGAPPGLPIGARWAAVTELAVRLWTSGEHHVSVGELEQLGEVLTALAKGGKGGQDEVGFQIGSGTLLVRDEDGRFSFIHESVMEWLVARAAADALAKEERPALLGQGKMSPLLGDFLIDLAGAEVVERWCARALAAGDGDNALLVRGRLLAAGLVRDEAENDGMDLAGQQLRGKDLSGQMLAGANLAEADLTGANLRGADLSGATLEGAVLWGADLSHANLSNADLRKADLVRARLLGARGLPAQLGGADLRWAKGIGSQLLDPAAIRDDSVRLHGAAAADAQPLPFVSLPFRNVRAMAASANGQLLAVADYRTIRLWDMVLGVELRRWPLSLRKINALAIDDEATTVAIGSSEGEVVVWELDRGAPTEVRRHDAGILGLCFGPDGLWSASKDGVLVDGGESTHELCGPSESITAIAFDPTHDLVVTGGGRGTIAMHRSGRLVRKRERHEHTVRAIAMSPSGDSFASVASKESMVLLSSVVKGVMVRTLSRPATHVAYLSPSLVLVGSDDGDLELVDLETSTRSSLDTGLPRFRALATYEGDVLVASSTQVVGYSLDRPTSPGTDVSSSRSPEVRSKARLGSPPFTAIRALAPLDGGGLSILLDESVVCATAEQSLTEQIVVFATPAVKACLARNGREAILHDRGGAISRHYSITSSTVAKRWGERVAFDAPPTAVTLLGRDSSRLLYSVALDRSRHDLRELQVDADGTSVVEHRGTVGPVVALASSPDGRWIGAACEDRTLSFFSPLSRKALAPPLVLEGHRYPVTTFEISDEPLAVSGSGDGSVLLWDLHAGKLRHQLSVPANTTATAFGPGHLVAAGSGRGHLHLWHTGSGEVIGQVTAHDAALTAIAFPSPSRIATGSRDGVVKLWRLPSLTLLATLVPRSEGWVAFAPDGRYKAGGRVTGEFWHSAGLCRFEVGELGEVLPDLRVDLDEPLIAPDPD